MSHKNQCASAEAWAEVDGFLTGLLTPPDDALTAAQRRADAAGLPPHEITPLQGNLLAILARLSNARLVLEIGTLAGVSTIWLARGLPPGGKIVTLESDRLHAAVARENLAAARLEKTIDLRVGPALETLPVIAAEIHQPFDLVFLDADKSSNPAYLDWALRLVRPGALIIADNIVREGTIYDPADDDHSAIGARTFLERLSADPRVTATALQTVGEKGWDGFALAVVVSPNSNEEAPQGTAVPW